VSELNLSHVVVPVSAVIPCYRHIETLKRAVASVAGQTVKPMEMIVVNDGGGKRVDKEIEELQARYGATWLSMVALPRNLGAGAARNAGWSRAKGTYVAFLDADDAWHPRKIEVQYGYMVTRPDIAVCGHRHRLEANDAHWVDYALTGRCADVKLARLLLANQFITSSAMVRRDLDVRFAATQRYMEDFRIWLTVLIRGRRMVILEDELACIFKPIFGSSGLSANLIRMEIGELRTYLSIGVESPLLLPAIFLFIPYSLGKFLRRWLLVMIRRAYRRRLEGFFRGKTICL